MLFVYNALLVAEHRSLMSARQLVCPSGHTGSQRDDNTLIIDTISQAHTCSCMHI